MTDNQLQDSAMVDRVADLMEENNEVIATKPLIIEAYAQAKPKIALIHANHTVQLGDITGVTRNKEGVREQLITYLKKDIKKVLGYFELKKMVQEATHAREMLSTLVKIQDNELIDLTEAFVLLVTPHLAELGQLNLKDAHLAMLNDLTLTYGTLIKARAKANTASVEATSNVDLLLKEVKAIFKLQLDNLMEVFDDENPLLLRQYQAARKVVYRHRRKDKEASKAGTATATVKLLDATTHEPIDGGTLTVDGKAIEDMTDEFGEIDLLDLKPGTHEITGVAEGYTAKTITAATPKADEDYTFELELTAV
jgi:hypothetical protein